jgi:hypothetical protein
MCARYDGLVALLFWKLTHRQNLQAAFELRVKELHEQLQVSSIGQEESVAVDGEDEEEEVADGEEEEEEEAQAASEEQVFCALDASRSGVSSCVGW